MDTKEKTSLLKLHKYLDSNVSRVDDRYIYSRAGGDFWLEYPRLMVDTATWAVRPIAEFSPAEQARIEAGWERWRDEIGGFQNNTPYHSPEGRYYFQSYWDIDEGVNIRTVVVYTADGRELIRYKGYITQAVWAHDSGGVYLRLSKTAFPFFLSGAPGSIVKLKVPQK